MLIGKGLTDNSNTFLDIDLYSHKVKFTNSWIQNPFASTPDETVNFMTVGDPFEYKVDTNTFLFLRFSLHKTQYKGERVAYDVF